MDLRFQTVSNTTQGGVLFSSNHVLDTCLAWQYDFSQTTEKPKENLRLFLILTHGGCGRCRSIPEKAVGNIASDSKQHRLVDEPRTVRALQLPFNGAKQILDVRLGTHTPRLRHRLAHRRAFVRAYFTLFFA